MISLLCPLEGGERPTAKKRVFCKALQVNSMDIRAKSCGAAWKVAYDLSCRQHTVVVHSEQCFSVPTCKTARVSLRTTHLDWTRARAKVSCLQGMQSFLWCSVFVVSYAVMVMGSGGSSLSSGQSQVQLRTLASDQRVCSMAGLAQVTCVCGLCSSVGSSKRALLAHSSTH